MSMKVLPSLRRAAAGCAGVVVAVLVAACAAPPQATSVAEMPFEQAVAQAADGLIGQVQKGPAFLAKLAKRTVVLDPMLDAATGQQTAATSLLETRVSERLTANADMFEILPFQSANLSKAQYLLTGTMTRVEGDGTAKKRALRIQLALTDLKSGVVAAQASALARDEGLDHTPLPYYRDSPVLVKDKVIEGYARTSATPPGQRGDAFYLERIAEASLIHEATSLYNQERYVEALGRYRSALAMPTGEQLRIVNGIYLASAKLGRTAEAEQAFGRVVALGIAYNELGVKFLFAPGSVEFWADPKISGAYQMWLRQIARGAVAAGSCMSVVGHTSKSGPAAVNDALSLKRATTIKQKLVAEQPVLAAKTMAEGMGFRQNIVGSGTDNSFDVLDRRVEFKIVPCR
jgi:outer membrane protein OmpA-like peptidoglycan-associated protein